MAISSVSQSTPQPYFGANAAAKPATQDAVASGATPAAPETAKAATPAKSSAPDSDDSKGESGSKGSSSAGESMFKLNPDGTLGPLHLPRPGHAPGVVHA